MKWICGASAMRIVGAVLVAAFVLGMASTVEAKWQPPKAEISGMFGWMYYDHARSLKGFSYGARGAYFFAPMIGIEGQFMYAYGEQRSGPDLQFWIPQADLIFQVPAGKIIPFGKVGAGNMGITIDGSDAERVDRFALDFGAGAKIWFNDYFGVRAGWDWYLTKNKNQGTPYLARETDDQLVDWTFNIGAQVGFGGGETDADGDGVPDDIDQCPNTPIGVTVDTRGCPLDTDNDGVPDYKDDCPNTVAGATVDANGCPIDSDGDGVPDGIDQCPNTPAGAEVDARGCPVDTDGDGVFNGLDQCPNTPQGVEVDATGCPIAKEIEAKFVLHGVNFASGSAEILEISYSALNEVAESLMAYPDVAVEIRGYTDSSGSDELNLRLSQDRANAVKDYLVSQGVDASRLVAKGYGETDPIATNDTPEGRTQNRRVEMHRLN